MISILLKTIPLLFMVLTILLAASYPPNGVGFALITVIPIALLFFWGAFWPDVFGYSELLVLGLLADVMLGTTLGVHGLWWLLLRGFVVWHRDTVLKQNFMTIWILFSITGVMFTALYALLLKLAGVHVAFSLPIMLEYGLLLLLYPFIHIVQSVIHRGLSEAELYDS